MTQQELRDEFRLLTKSILQDSKVDTTEARVIKRWLEERGLAERFGFAMERLSRRLSDGYIDQFESREVVDALGFILRGLNSQEGDA